MHFETHTFTPQSRTAKSVSIKATKEVDFSCPKSLNYYKMTEFIKLVQISMFRF